MLVGTADEDVEVSFDFTNLDTVSGNHTVVAFPRYKDGSNFIEVRFRRDDFLVYKKVAGVYSLVATNSTMPLTQDKRYKVRVVASGDDLNVYVAEEGEVEVEVFDLTDTDFNFSSQNQVRFAVYKFGAYAIDNIRVVADDLSNTITMTHNDANELLTLTDRNGTTSYTYDDLGRTTGKTRASLSAAYTWGYGDFLIAVESDFPDEGDVDYAYGGEGGRAKRTTPGGDYTWYNENSDEAAGTNGDGDGALTRTYFEFGDVLGSDPATGDYRYYMTNHVTSVTSVYDENKNLIASFEYTPFGGAYNHAGPSDITMRFTGHEWDSDARLYYAPLRYYSPVAMRWMTNDPIAFSDGLNMYAYVGNNPILYFDPDGDFGQIIAGAIGGVGLGYLTAKLTGECYSWKDAAKDAALGAAGAGLLGKLGKLNKLRKAGRRCFVAGTLVATSDGFVPIEEIEVGHKVWSYDEESGTPKLEEVVETFIRQTEEVLVIEVGDQVIETTAEHPFYVSGRGWVVAEDLREGDHLLDFDGNGLVISGISFRTESVFVYNFEVENTNTYYVTADEILVHNTMCTRGGGRKPKNDIGDEGRDILQNNPRRPNETPSEYVDRVVPGTNHPKGIGQKLRKYLETKDMEIGI